MSAIHSHRIYSCCYVILTDTVPHHGIIGETTVSRALIIITNLSVTIVSVAMPGEGEAAQELRHRCQITSSSSFSSAAGILLHHHPLRLFGRMSCPAKHDDTNIAGARRMGHAAAAAAGPGPVRRRPVLGRRGRRQGRR